MAGGKKNLKKKNISWHIFKVYANQISVSTKNIIGVQPHPSVSVSVMVAF